jgi:CheY-like chemotaxis protein
MAKILVADDEEALRTFLSRALALRGHTVTAVADGSEALDALANDSFDLLLSDIVMPIMDGIALALKASRDYPRMTIIMMTGYVAEKKRAEDLNAFVHDIVSKPFTMDLICSVVDDALSKSPASA